MGILTSILKGIGIIVGLIALAVVLTLFAARFADGPWAVISGGSFSSGEVVSEDRHLVLDVYVAHWIAGEIRLKDHDAAR